TRQRLSQPHRIIHRTGRPAAAATRPAARVGAAGLAHSVAPLNISSSKPPRRHRLAALPARGICYYFFTMSQHLSPPHTAVLIGRFQPLHNGHLALLRQALAAAQQAVVILGSACQARSPKNPFTWQERAQLIQASLPPDD